MKKIQKIKAKKPVIKKRLRVAAYARVSADKGRTPHSLSAQISYYSAYIQKNPEWKYAGVYSDNGISGGSVSARTSFKQMLQDCEDGKIDVILTKNISRFARNTVDLLETVRHLKTLGVEVVFEKENIRSMSGDGELMLSILASFAQEEIQSMSKNIKWSIQKRYKKGLPNSRSNLYGYRWQGDELIVVPEEAEVVKEIYANYFKQISAEKTAKMLTERGIKGFTGGDFKGESVRSILLNVTYTGNLLLQKEFIVDPLTKKSKRNNGELPQYWVENHHEAIISLETFQAAQEERARRQAQGVTSNWSINTSCLTSNIRCGCCGYNYQRRVSSAKQRYHFWSCRTKQNKGAKHCPSKNIKEWQIKDIASDVLGLTEFDGEHFSKEIDHILITGFQLDFVFQNGKVVQRTFERHENPRKVEWTDEMRQALGEKIKERKREKREQKSNHNTSNDK